ARGLRFRVLSPGSKGRKFFERPFMKRLLENEEVSMKEVRDFMVSILAEYKAFSLCSDCPEYQGPAKKIGCCGGCPLHEAEVGCTLRNTGCLGWACNSLVEYLREKGGLTELNAMRSLFGDLDDRRGQCRHVRQRGHGRTRRHQQLVGHL
ncbi:hypothetical protein LCGC14_2928650, partial [marine sediment metagenome]